MKFEISSFVIDSEEYYGLKNIYLIEKDEGEKFYVIKLGYITKGKFNLSKASFPEYWIDKNKVSFVDENTFKQIEKNKDKFIKRWIYQENS